MKSIGDNFLAAIPVKNKEQKGVDYKKSSTYWYSAWMLNTFIKKN